MADISGIERAVRVAMGGAVTSVTWSSRGAFHKQQQQQQLQQLQSRVDAQRSFTTPSGGISQPYAGMTSPMTSQQVRPPARPPAV